MVNIIYMDFNGEQQVLNEITKIALSGITGNYDARELSKYIAQGLDLIEETGIPSNKRLTLFSEEENGDLRTFQILKELVHSSRPLMEFRINRSEPGAFRAIFFTYRYENEDYIIFTKAVLKKGVKNPPEFQAAIRESEIMYDSFFMEPLKYLGGVTYE